MKVLFKFRFRSLEEIFSQGGEMFDFVSFVRDENVE